MRHYFLCVESDTLAEASRPHNKREALAPNGDTLSPLSGPARPPFWKKLFRINNLQMSNL